MDLHLEQMKLTFKKSDRKPGNSFLVRRDTIPCIEQNWHFHPELELIYFMRSTGTRYVGNSIGSFEPNELYLIGSNVPHLFTNEREYYQNEGVDEGIDIIVVKFEPDFLGSEFLSLTETHKIIKLFENANRGIKFSKPITYLAHNYLVGLVGSEGLSSIIGLLKILDILSVSETFTPLCSEDISHSYKNDEKERMSEILNYLNQNYEKRIELSDLASIAHLTPNSFCRYFKNHTRKSFAQYLSEIRINRACKLLIEGELQISDICYQVGFNTFTNFNRHFKSIMKTTPTEFMKRYEMSSN